MQPSPSKKPEETCFALPPRELLKPRRLDLIVKWRLYSELGGSSIEGTHNPDRYGSARQFYLWHIAKRRESGFVDSNKRDAWHCLQEAQKLYWTMRVRGFDPAFPVPVDPNNDILGGAHRTACALALGIDVLIDRRDTAAWAPAWDAAWFRQHGMPEGEVEKLIADYERLKSKEA